MAYTGNAKTDADHAGVLVAFGVTMQGARVQQRVAQGCSRLLPGHTLLHDVPGNCSLSTVPQTVNSGREIGMTHAFSSSIDVATDLIWYVISDLGAACQ